MKKRKKREIELKKQELTQLRKEYRDMIEAKRDDFVIIPCTRFKYGVWFDFWIRCDQLDIPPGEVLAKFMVDFALYQEIRTKRFDMSW